MQVLSPSPDAAAATDPATRLCALLGRPDDLAWEALLAPCARYETLGETLPGAEAIRHRLEALSAAALVWTPLAHPAAPAGCVVVKGAPPAGAAGRTYVLTAEYDAAGQIVSLAQQFLGAPTAPPAPLSLPVELQQRFAAALANRHAMYLSYVDGAGRPHLSQRGSVVVLAPDRIGLWARAGGGMPAALAANPHVALMYRDEATRATYALSGRAHVATDQATRATIYDAMPVAEQRHDFARLGSAIVVDLDSVTGHAGLGPTGPIDPVNLVRR